MTPDAAAEIERLTRENEDLRQKLKLAKGNAAQARVDADRREKRALALLPDCEAHRNEIKYLRGLISWYYADMNRHEDARSSMVRALIIAGKKLEDRTEPVPVPNLLKAINDWTGPQAAIIRRPIPDFDDLSDDVKRDIARVLGITAEHCKEVNAGGRLF